MSGAALKESQVVGICLALVIPAAATAVFIPDLRVRQILLSLITMTVAGGLTWIGWRMRARVDGRFARFLRLLTMSAAIWLLAAVIWLLSSLLSSLLAGAPWTAAIDLCLFIAYLPLLGSLIALARPDISRGEQIRCIVDALVLLVGGAVILWSVLGGIPMDGSRTGQLVSFGFVLADLGLVSALVSLAAQRHSAGLWSGVGPLTLAVLIAAAVGLGMMLGYLRHPMLGASWAAVGTILQAGLFALGALRMPRTEPAYPPDPLRFQRGQAMSLALALLVTLAAVIVATRPEALSGTFVPTALTILALLVLIRMLVDQRDLRRALVDLSAAHRALEVRVVERTEAARLATSAHQRAVEAEAEHRLFSEILREVVLTVANAEDLRTALQAVLSAVRAIGPVDASGILFIEDGVARTVFHDGYAERDLGPWVEALAMPVEATPGLQRMFHQGEPLLQADTDGLAEWSARPELSWVHSYLGAPLRARGRTFGFINLVSATPRGFTEVHTRRLQAIAHSVALALENARLLARTRRRLERLGVLLDVSTGLNREADLATGLQDAVWRFGQAAEMGSLLILGGPAGAPWSALAAHGLPPEESGLVIDASVLAEIGLLGGDWTVVPQPVDDLRLAVPALERLRGMIAGHGADMLVVVPLRMRERLHGALLALAERELSTADGELLRILAAVVTARMEADSRLEAERTARAQAEEASRLKGEFLANTSHELRTPLTGILLSLELAMDPALDSPADRHELIDTAHHSGRRLLTTINGLLDLAKIEAGSLDVHPERLDPERAIAAAAEPLMTIATRRGVSLSITGWTIGGPLPVRADPALLHQILTNLIGNALKFTEQGGVVISLSAVDRRVRIRIADTGVGISPEAMARLFRPFVQGDGSSTRRFEGTGLGLVIARHMAELMGGRLTLASPGVGSGTVAEIELPSIAA